MVLVADPVVSMAHRLDRQLATRCIDENQFATGEFFRGAAFVGVDMGHIAANHRIVRLRKRLQAEAIRRRAIENDKDFHIRPEVLLELANRSLSVRVVPVTHRVPRIRAGNGSQDLGMDASVVVAGEAACRFHSNNNVAEGWNSDYEIRLVCGWILATRLCALYFFRSLPHAHVPCLRCRSESGLPHARATCSLALGSTQVRRRCPASRLDCFPYFVARKTLHRRIYEWRRRVDRL